MLVSHSVPVSLASRVPPCQTPRRSANVLSNIGTRAFLYSLGIASHPNHLGDVSGKFRDLVTKPVPRCQPKDSSANRPFSGVPSGACCMYSFLHLGRLLTATVRSWKGRLRVRFSVLGIHSLAFFALEVLAPSQWRRAWHQPD